MTKKQEYEERPQLQIDLFEVQREWEHWQERELNKEKEKKQETVIIIDI